MAAATMAGQALWILAALAFVLGLINIGLRKVLPRLSGGSPVTRTRMRVIQRVSLGRQQALVMVEINDRLMVVGVTDHEIRTVVDRVDPPAPHSMEVTT